MKKKILVLVIAICLCFTFVSCGKNDSKSSSDSAKNSTSTDSSTSSGSTKSSSTYDINAVSPDVKEFLDEYESFVDEYLAFMEKYKNNPSDTSLLTDLSTYTQKLTDFGNKAAEIKNKSMSADDLAYYTEVYTRISKKLVDAGKK